jgi:hypothetical protein
MHSFSMAVHLKRLKKIFWQKGYIFYTQKNSLGSLAEFEKKMKIDLIFAAARAFRCGSIGHAVARAGVEAEQLSADPVVFEAGRGAAIFAALRVKGEQLAREHPRQALLFVRRVVHARGRFTTENVSVK